jgi:transposase
VCISTVPASLETEGKSMGRSRGGLTSKIHAVVDTNGLPVRLALTAGEAHDNRLADSLLSGLKSGSLLLADRAYDADWIRALVTKRRAWANIPPRSNRNEPICFSQQLYRARNLVERFFNKIKQCRRIATRYDKLVRALLLHAEATGRRRRTTCAIRRATAWAKHRYQSFVCVAGRRGAFDKPDIVRASRPAVTFVTLIAFGALCARRASSAGRALELVASSNSYGGKECDDHWQMAH